MSEDAEARQGLLQPGLHIQTPLKVGDAPRQHDDL